MFIKSEYTDNKIQTYMKRFSEQGEMSVSVCYKKVWLWKNKGKVTPHTIFSI